MSLSGLTLSFIKGWSLTLAMLLFVPFFALSLNFLLTSLKRRTSTALQSYSTSNGLAQ